jgi:hypothetical protein
MFRFVKLYFLDILNWLYFRRIVNKFQNTDKWKQLRLRKNLIGEVYTVVRLRDEDLGDPDEIMTVRLLEVAREANIFISQMDIQFEVGGLVLIDYYHIPEDPNAFLIIWQPKLQIMSIKATLKFLTGIATITGLSILGYKLIPLLFS